MLMSDLTHRSLACKAHLNMLIENARYKFITIRATCPVTLTARTWRNDDYRFQFGAFKNLKEKRKSILVTLRFAYKVI